MRKIKSLGIQIREAASIITLDYDHKSTGKNQNMHGNAGGTATFRDLSDASGRGANGYDDAYRTQEVPVEWEKLPVNEKVKWLYKNINSGCLKYQQGMHSQFLTIVINLASLFDKSLAQCVTFTGKLPDFLTNWLTPRKLAIFPLLEQSVKQQMVKLPPDKQKLYYLFAA